MSTRVLGDWQQHARRAARERPERVQGHVERVADEGFLQLRYGKEAGEYLILHVPATCRIHQAGEQFPLKDVQFCDSVSVSYHSHHRFDV
ncbi:MAG TPA: hypothetical protein PLX97_10555, partial [Gemmatales bacterium]|nr:hypothetical protein [Gemmatales bacterium]